MAEAASQNISIDRHRCSPAVTLVSVQHMGFVGKGIVDGNKLHLTKQELHCDFSSTTMLC